MYVHVGVDTVGLQLRYLYMVSEGVNLYNVSDLVTLHTSAEIT